MVFIHNLPAYMDSHPNVHLPLFVADQLAVIWRDNNPQVTLLVLNSISFPFQTPNLTLSNKNALLDRIKQTLTKVCAVKKLTVRSMPNPVPMCIQIYWDSGTGGDYIAACDEGAQFGRHSRHLRYGLHCCYGPPTRLVFVLALKLEGHQLRFIIYVHVRTWLSPIWAKPSLDHPPSHPDERVSLLSISQQFLTEHSQDDTCSLVAYVPARTGSGTIPAI